MRYVITGDSGMLASVLDRVLKAEGHVRLSPPAQEVPRWVSPSTGVAEPDFRSPQYRHWLSDLKLDVFIHSGALVGTTRCEAHAEEAWSCNVTAVQDLGRILSRRMIYTVFLATAAEMEPNSYGLDRPIVVAKTPANPLTRYGMTKLAGRLLLETLYHFADDEDLLQVYPSFGFGGPRDGNSCVADVLKCAAGVYQRRAFLPLDPNIVKEVTPHDYIARVIVSAINHRISGKIPVASGLWLKYGDVVSLIEGATGVKAEVDWHPELDYKGDFVHAPEDVDRVCESTGVGRMTELDLIEALRVEWNAILESKRTLTTVATHEWRFAEKLAEAFPGWEGRRK
jgi:nucleoside-diphosphate-sugar epimerase